jgi:hypothetical protein
LKSSENPAGLIVRDRRTGQLVAVPICEIPKALWPETWYANVDWQYSRAVTREEVGRFFTDPKTEISEDLARKLAKYIYDYAANVSVAGWLFSEDPDAYLEYMKPCLEKLAALKAKCRTRSGVMDMVHVAIDYAVDPF